MGMRKLLLILLLASLNLSAQPPMRKLLGKRSVNLLLDLYPSAARAYSVRKLRTAYTGYCLRVYRSSDAATQDIGFTVNGDLDTASLKTFIGSNSGYVTIWYDQSGNLFNATAVTTGGGRIVNAGVVERQGAMPALVFVPANSTKMDFSGVASNADFSIYVVSKRRVAGVVGAIISNNAANPTLWFGQFSDNNFYTMRGTTGTTGFYRPSADATAVFSLIESYNISNTSSAYKNATAYSLGTEVSDTRNNLAYSRIGRIGETASLFSDAKISEVVIYASDKSSSRAGIAANINSYYTIY